MPGPANGGRNGGSKKKQMDSAVMDNFREVCPPHKRKDLDKLVKSLNGDETKIMQTIQEWWDEPQKQEEEWADVNKKGTKKKPEKTGGRGGGRGQGPGRGGRYGRGGGGRGGGRDRDRGGRSGDRGRGGPPQHRNVGPPQTQQKAEDGGKSDEGVATQTGVPAPVASAPTPKGAWGARAASSAAAPSAPSEPAAPVAQPKPEDTAPPPEKNPLDAPLVSQNDPTPSGLPATEVKPVTRAPAGNVWATKGSAHLIRAEKPKPPTFTAPAPTPPAPPVAPIAPAPIQKSVEPEPPAPVVTPPAVPSIPEPTLESGLPPGVTASTTSAWGNQPDPTPPNVEPEPSTIDIPPPPSPSVPMAPVSSVEPVVPASPKPTPVQAQPSPAAPANMLNMGHWETGDGEDTNLDFGFGSFGEEPASATNGVSASPAAGMEAPDPQTSAAATSVSPARPPPGLSLGGMPPMPESAVMVHELENKMESASLNAATQKEQPVQEKSIASTLPTQPAPAPQNAPAPVLPAGVTQQNYNQYGMPGMYNYTAAAGNGFVGMPGAPVLAGGVVPQQPGKPQGAGVSQPTGPGVIPSAPQNIPPQGLYGAQPPPAPSSGNATGGDSTDAAPAPAAGIPPGMPSAIPYANPALHYGQHQFYMGQQHQNIGYNYGYGQFGGLAQGGFGYQQVMGQNQGYGGPHYEDQSHQQNSHHSGGSGGYQKNSGGGYRGRNNQYQNQYNPQQHAGYGGQPYGMGYHGDHFNQRGGYPGGMGDPYGMQQGSGNYPSGGFHDDDHQKGKKGGRGNNSSLQQFQQGAPHQLGQQPFGLQGQGGQGSESTPSTGGGWSNQGGGWSGGGAPSWQGS